jgi:8-oxo-dGTP pyrophosphatase MutT (NUDIX family)
MNANRFSSSPDNVRAVLFDADDPALKEFWVLVESDDPAPKLPGGKIDQRNEQGWSETPDEAIRRELYEEFGLNDVMLEHAGNLLTDDHLTRYIYTGILSQKTHGRRH